MEFSKPFNWETTNQLSLKKIIMAFFVPSAVAFTGFRVILPILVNNNMPTIIAWPLVASLMLLGLVIVAIILLKKEATRLNISLKSRMCLGRLSFKQWVITLGVLLLGLLATIMFSKLSIYFTNFPGLSVPDYFPFFLNPHVDPIHTNPSLLTPGFTLKGAYFLIPLISTTLFLNILTEELYFRAYLLPKMYKYKKMSWILNGTLFALYHTYQFWLFPQILPISLAVAFVVYKNKNIWPAFIIHMVTNLMTVAGMVYLIAA